MIILIIAAVVGVAAFILGGLMAHRYEMAAGQALIIGGTIIIAAALIASARGEAKR